MRIDSCLPMNRLQCTIPFIKTAVLILLYSSITAHSNAQSTQIEWESELHINHDLTGQIWLVAENRFITRDELLARLAGSDVVLLGEKHDNPDHHKLRLGILQSLLSGGEPSLLVMEMLTEAQQPALDALGAQEPIPPADDWQQLLEWDEGWTWTYYQPVLELALQNNTRLQAGNISAGQLMEIYRADEPVAATQVLGAAQLTQLAQEIDQSHCGMLSEAQIPSMVRVQQARDRQMADALLSPGEFRQRILVAGNYHIRHDLSVPAYLRVSENVDITSNTPASVLNLAFLEVDPTLLSPTDYLDGTDLANTDGQPVYDLVWFTPAVQADDYCADLAPASQ